MKILIVTQKVDKDDDVLGFFHDWVKEFARQYNKVTVVCLEMGEYELPGNALVLSLGKEELSARGGPALGWRIIKKIRYLFNFYRYILKHRKEYDLVFVHMIPMYAIIGWPVWKILKKKLTLWYAHGHVSLALRVAEKMVDIIFTSTKEGCRLASRKIEVVGQGIDTEKFSNFACRDVPRHVSMRDKQYSTEKNNFNIISVGRIAPIKDYETLIQALEVLVKNYKLRKVRLQIVGGALLDQHEQYFRKLKKMVSDLSLEKYVEFTGSVSFTKIQEYLERANLMASTSRTGSLDKVMLEAMSMELPVITCNESMHQVLFKKEKELMYKKGDFKRLADLIVALINLDEGARKKLGKSLRDRVVRDHSLSGLIKKIKKCAE